MESRVPIAPSADSATGPGTVASGLRPDIRPPNEPWVRLDPAASPGGYLSYYYSDSLSRIPVRAVTRFVGRRFDNKSDPNFETRTYGLFSTCEVTMRASVVSRRAPYLVFVTTVGTRRCVSGYFRIGWWAPGPPMAAYQTRTGLRPDVMLAADDGWFVSRALPLDELSAELDDPGLSGWFRTFKGISPTQVEGLIGQIRARPDATAEYVDEVHRLERLNLRFTGFRYPGWRRVDHFDWEAARKYLPTERDLSPVPAPPYVDKTRIKYWTCLACGGRVDDLAPLKRCPWCERLGTLVGRNR